MHLTDFAKWTGVTEQQARIVSIIKRLQEQKQPTRPIDIEKEYISETKTFIQKSNLFAQLKLLQEKEIISKNGQSQYAVNIEGIRNIILSKKSYFSTEIENISKFALETEKFLENLAQQTTVHVEHLSETELYKKLAFYLKNATAFYLGCDFPHYAYSLSICGNSQQAAYIETLGARIADEKFTLFCLCTYKTDEIVGRLSKKYTNKEFIREEIQRAHKEAQEKTIQFNTIDLRKTATPFNFALIEDAEHRGSLFMFLKDSKGEITGGIVISSPETLKHLKQHFLAQMATASSLKSKDDFVRLQKETLMLPSQETKNKLIAFDVNRVFTVNHTTVELAELTGKKEKVSEFITKQIEGKMGVQEAIEESAKLLKGLSVKMIEQLVPTIPLMKHLEQGLKKLKNAGYHLIAISTGFSHVITPLCRSLGIDDIYCNVLEEKNGKLTGVILEKNVVTDNVKYYIVKYLLEKYSIPLENSISVGDGFSDLDLLKATKVRIAFNPTKSMIRLFEERSPLITHLITEQDFGVLANEIMKRV
ncbi:MAG TPA: HAD-IB family phosphatase [Candidatus Nanoarchaeia archaeon]|nr:HAD-IB family phosphatase [Candidatus Nanoarchaeia archaeon]